MSGLWSVTIVKWSNPERKMLHFFTAQATARHSSSMTVYLLSVSVRNLDPALRFSNLHLSRGTFDEGRIRYLRYLHQCGGMSPLSCRSRLKSVLSLALPWREQRSRRAPVTIGIHCGGSAVVQGLRLFHLCWRLVDSLGRRRTSGQSAAGGWEL